MVKDDDRVKPVTGRVIQGLPPKGERGERHRSGRKKRGGEMDRISISRDARLLSLLGEGTVTDDDDSSEKG